MLDQKTIEIVKSTVPVLEEKGVEITTRFYERLFESHPELLNVFNHANQKQGRQQTALANAVYAAAAHIDHLEEILPSVQQVFHKHRSIGVKPEHYPIVGENLLLAIQDVLGLSENDEIILAWKAAYGEIANAFIGAESKMYEAAESQSGGWDGFREFIVERKVKESDVITSFYLKPEDGKPIPSFQPGQYISVKLRIQGESYTHIRQYSLSDAPDKNYYRISVKREDEQDPNGMVSVYLHENVEEGDVISISAPAGDFTLNAKDDLPAVLISGGVGLTPMMSMLNTIVDQNPGREVTFIHAARNGKMQAMRNQVAELAEEHKNVQLYVCYDSPTEEDRKEQRFDKEGYINLEWLQSILPDRERTFYFCGPVPFMKAIRRALKEWGVPEERIHFEFFGPAMALEDPEEKEYVMN
ncbi:MAG TPA: NO-inducible flavohemoprotein [Bacillales bacterium]|nr:NO-inducible flavohemoprotein [Bacillales bacterium]